jgi:pimeloyl-ACP methyl ester carboxylesterase
MGVLERMTKIQLRNRHRRHSSPGGRDSLTSLSCEIIGNIYQAITGNVPMPQHFVRRALANGLPEEEFQHAIRSAGKIRALPDFLLAASEQKLERALYWDELGLKPRARDLYLESAHWALYAEILTEDEGERQLIYSKYRESYRRAAPYFTHSAEEISINFLSNNLSGYLRLPGEGENLSDKVPVVILLNGFFSAREELHYLENSLLAQGFATLCLDYPGPREHSGQVPAAFDVKELGNALYFFLMSRPEIDCARITLYGLSLGSRIAIYLALANPELFGSVVVLSCPVNVLADLDRLTPVFAREHMISHPAARAALYELALQTQFEELIENLESPLLVIGGGKDKIAPVEATREIFERSLSSDKKLVICPAAGHGLYEMMPSLRYEIAQWIKQRA